MMKKIFMLTAHAEGGGGEKVGPNRATREQQNRLNEARGRVQSTRPGSRARARAEADVRRISDEIFYGGRGRSAG